LLTPSETINPMGTSFTAADERWMMRAMALAARSRGRVEPNPMVGCVIVRGDRVIGEGYHHRFGGPHAEVDALAHCGSSPRGATAYVTLEPCCHVGKTGPCADALVAAGIGRVVAAMQDPFGKVAGKGFRLLRQAGMRVDVGLCHDEAERLNAPYLKLRRTGVPWVILKWAQSLDGRIATRTGQARWISGPQSRRVVHHLRGRVDAIVVGIGTVLADDPMLTCRGVRARRVAHRIVLDTRLRIPLRSRLLRTVEQAPVLIMTTSGAVRRQRGKADRLRAAGAKVLSMRSRRGRLDVRGLLAELGRREMTNVLVEGGAEVLGTFLDERLADEAYVFVAPRIIGGRDAPGAVGGTGPASVSEASPMHGVRCRRVGEDWLYQFRLRDAGASGVRDDA
jgi:diaminohydroxyphosphoribosylaminopyrimidine deaminase/5-amino-6-(5-phosphoribosylamino)uracil reductase